MSLYPAFARPRSLDQATELLAGLSTGAIIIAGGQEVMPNVNYGLMAPSLYVDIGHIAALKGVKEDSGEVIIGALTVHRQIQDDAVINASLPLLAYSAKQIGGGMQVHNRGTIGGNIVSMHPLYDIAPSLSALEAEVEITSGDGIRRVAFSELVKETAHGLGTEAILTRIFIKPMADQLSWAYQKLKNSGGAYGAANAAATLTLDSGKVSTLRVAIGAASEQLLDASDALQSCVGQAYSKELAGFIEQACAALITRPLSDHQGDGEWRRAMAGVMARRAVEAAFKASAEQSMA